MPVELRNQKGDGELQETELVWGKDILYACNQESQQQYKLKRNVQMFNMMK